jgi:hypothetical protein
MVIKIYNWKRNTHVSLRTWNHTNNSIFAVNVRILNNHSTYEAEIQNCKSVYIKNIPIAGLTKAVPIIRAEGGF